MNTEFDNLVDAFVRYYNGRIRELCDEVGQQSLFENYALSYNNDTSKDAANTLKRQKLAERERVHMDLEEIFATRKIPMMPGLAVRNNSPEPTPVEVASVAPDSVARKTPKVVQVAADSLKVETLRSVVNTFAVRMGIREYTAPF